MSIFDSKVQEDYQRDILIKNIKDARYKLEHESPCHHCGPGNGCDDCRGCPDHKVNYDLWKALDNAEKEFENAFGYKYKDGQKTVNVISAKEAHSKSDKIVQNNDAKLIYVMDEIQNAIKQGKFRCTVERTKCGQNVFKKLRDLGYSVSLFNDKLAEIIW